MIKYFKQLIKGCLQVKNYKWHFWSMFDLTLIGVTVILYWVILTR